MDLLTARTRVRNVVVNAIEHVRRRPHHAAAAAIVAVLAAVGLWSCQPTPSAGDSTLTALREPDVRVRIRQGVPRVELSGPAEFVLQPEHGKSAVLSGPLKVEATASGCRITDGRGKALDYTGGSPIDVIGVGEGSADPSLAGRVKVDGTPYPGTIRILPRGDGTRTPARLDVVEVVPIETYLVGVVAAELYRDWPLTAFQVQAVCARTYALHERARAQRQGRDYDLESTTQDQAYNGGTPLPVAVQAVNDTRGVVLTWQGRLLRAYYSSTCGGRTASARDVWPTGQGYEFNLDAPIQAHRREVACDASPRFRWEAVRDRAEVSRRIREWGKANGSPVAKLGLLVSVSAAETNADGRPTKYTLSDDRRATYTLPAESLRQACNQTVAGLPELTRQTRVWSSDMEFVGKGNVVSIRGRGFGHGVGMCQFCTKGFADRGRSWRQIVLGFYPGAKLERAY